MISNNTSSGSSSILLAHVDRETHGTKSTAMETAEAEADICLFWKKRSLAFSFYLYLTLLNPCTCWCPCLLIICKRVLNLLLIFCHVSVISFKILQKFFLDLLYIYICVKKRVLNQLLFSNMEYFKQTNLIYIAPHQNLPCYLLSL